MNRKTIALPAAMLLSAAVMSISAGPASAATSPDPVGDLINGVTSLLQPAATKAAPTKSAVSAPAPQSPSGTSAGNTTTPPQPPDHGSAKGVEVKIGTQPVVGVGNNNATVNDDDSTTAESQLLTLGGNSILGAKAASTGDNHDAFDPLAPITSALCDGSGGAACLNVLYATADATDDGKTSHSLSRSGITNACVGGTNTDPTAACNGPVSLAALSSSGQADRDQASGRTTASSLFDAANLCVQRDPITGLCAVGVGALHSEGQSDSGGATPSASRSSYLLDLQLGGMDLGRVDDPTDLSIQPACANPSLLCLFLNQGETYLAPGIAGHVQDALKATVLPGTLDLFAGVGHTETLVHNDGGNPPGNPSNPPKGPKDDDNGDGDDNGDDNNGDAALPDTGGPWSGLLALGLFGVAAGSFVVAGARRPARKLG